MNTLIEYFQQKFLLILHDEYTYILRAKWGENLSKRLMINVLILYSS
jgi:hypothetical protein